MPIRRALQELIGQEKTFVNQREHWMWVYLMDAEERLQQAQQEVEDAIDEATKSGEF